MLETGLLPPDVKKNALFLGNAGLWKNDALKVGLPVTSTPTAGARGLVVWPPNTKGAGSVGHVAFLEEVYPDGRVRITEANWPTGSGIKERILTPAQYAGVSFVRLENAQTNSYNAPPAKPGQQRQYVVRSGDTLSAIALRELGNANRWTEIKKVDGSTFTAAEAQSIKPGQSVYLPVSYQTGPGVSVTPKPSSKPIVNSDIRFYDGRKPVNDSGLMTVKKARDKDWNTNKSLFFDDKDLAKVWLAHQALKTSWQLLGWDDAAELLGKYLDSGNGGEVSINLDEAILESSEMASELIESFSLSEILNAVQQGYKSGVFGNNWDTAGSLDLFPNNNWLQALGGFSKRYEGSFQKNSDGSISISMKFFLKDIYDFVEPKWNLTKSHDLHLYGLARAFLTMGESKTYTWKFNLSGMQLERPSEFASTPLKGTLLLPR